MKSRQIIFFFISSSRALIQGRESFVVVEADGTERREPVICVFVCTLLVLCISSRWKKKEGRKTTSLNCIYPPTTHIIIINLVHFFSCPPPPPLFHIFDFFGWFIFFWRVATLIYKMHKDKRHKDIQQHACTHTHTHTHIFIKNKVCI